MPMPPRATSSAQIGIAGSECSDPRDHDLEAGRLGNGQPLAAADLVPPSHGLMRVRPQPAKPLVSRATTGSTRATKSGGRYQCKSNVWIGVPGLTAADDDFGIAVGCRGIEGKNATAADPSSNIAAAALAERGAAATLRHDARCPTGFLRGMTAGGVERGSRLRCDLGEHRGGGAGPASSSEITLVSSTNISRTGGITGRFAWRDLQVISTGRGSEAPADASAS